MMLTTPLTTLPMTTTTKVRCSSYHKITHSQRGENGWLNWLVPRHTYENEMKRKKRNERQVKALSSSRFLLIPLRNDRWRHLRGGAVRPRANFPDSSFLFVFVFACFVTCQNESRRNITSKRNEVKRTTPAFMKYHLRWSQAEKYSKHSRAILIS